MDTIKALSEVLIKMKFYGNKGDTLARCDAAGIKTHIQSRAEYEAIRDSQKKDATATGIDAERFGRVDRLDNVIYDAGVQIAANTDVALASFQSDLVACGFRLVGLGVFQGFGKPAHEYLLVSTYSRDPHEPFELTPQQKKLHEWFFARTYGNVYVWRNLGGAQFDIPAIGIRQDSKVRSIDLRLYSWGRRLVLGEKKVEVAFEGDASTVTA